MNFRSLALALLPIHASAQLNVIILHTYNAFVDPSYPAGSINVYDDAGKTNFYADSGNPTQYNGFPDGLFDIVFDTYNNMDFIIRDPSSVTYPDKIIPPGHEEIYYFDYFNAVRFAVIESFDPNFNVTAEIYGMGDAGTIPIPFTNDNNSARPGSNFTVGDFFEGRGVIKISILEGTDLSVIGSKFRHKARSVPPMTLYATVTNNVGTETDEFANGVSLANAMRAKDARIPDFPPFGDSGKGLFTTRITGDTVTMTVSDISGLPTPTITGDDAISIYVDSNKDLGSIYIDTVDPGLNVTVKMVTAGTPLAFGKMSNITEFIPPTFAGDGFIIRFLGGTNWAVNQTLTFKYYERTDSCDDMLLPTWPKFVCSYLPTSSCIDPYNSTHVFAQVCPTQCGMLPC